MILLSLFIQEQDDIDFELSLQRCSQSISWKFNLLFPTAGGYTS